MPLPIAQVIIKINYPGRKSTCVAQLEGIFFKEGDIVLMCDEISEARQLSSTVS